MTRRTHITLTDEMYDALLRLAKKRGIPVAHLIRQSIANYLQDDGVTLQDIHPAWGGPRTDGPNAEEE